MNDQPLIFDWDEANLAHIAQHDVTKEEAEQVFLGDLPDMDLQTSDASGTDERLLQLGETAKGRILQLVTTWRGRKVRVICMGRAKATQTLLSGRNEAATWRH